MFESRVKQLTCHARLALFAPALMAASAAAEPPELIQETTVPALPIAVSNNAVAAVKRGRREYVVSFNGLAAGIAGLFAAQFD